jgi:hypothetical protein
MGVPVLSLNDDLQSVDVIQMLISDEFRDWVRVCVVSQIQMLISDEFRDWVRICVISQIGLLIFQDLKEEMRSVSAGRVRLNCTGGAMIVLRLS